MLTTVPPTEDPKVQWFKSSLTIVRCCFVPFIVIGTVTNIINIRVFSQAKMRSLSTGNFLLALAVADITMIYFQVSGIPTFWDPTYTLTKTKILLGQVVPIWSKGRHLSEFVAAWHPHSRKRSPVIPTAKNWLRKWSTQASLFDKSHVVNFCQWTLNQAVRSKATLSAFFHFWETKRSHLSAGTAKFSHFFLTTFLFLG